MEDDPVSDGVIALRRWDAGDAQWYADSVRDADIQRFTSDRPDLSADEVARAIADLAVRTDRDGFLIGAAETVQRLGNLAVEYHDGTAEVSYWVAVEARGHGVAARALTLLAAWLAEHRDVGELTLWVHADNLGSARAAERAGFVRDPRNDRPREVKGQVWPTIAYRRGLR